MEERADSFDHLIYIRVFEGCNLYCEHCFIPANPKKMSIKQVKDVRNHVKQFAKKGDKLLFQWHGGEPTAIGFRFMKEAMEIIDSLNDEYSVVQGIQTNLTKYNSDWGELFMKYVGSEIGVSWDPEIRHLKRKTDTSNEEYEQVFWKNWEQAISDGFEPYVIVTGTKKLFERFPNPFNMIEFFTSKGIKKLHIERITKTGNAQSNWDSLGLTHIEYSTSMSKLLRAYGRYQDRNTTNEDRLFISPLDGYIESVVSLDTDNPQGYGCNSGKCDTAYHTVDAQSYKAGCTALTTDEREKTSAQVVSFTQLRRRREKRQESCLGCKYKPVCSSGCMTAEKFDGSGECFGGRMIFEQAEALLSRKS
ncbi:radical SAM protein [Vibrio owensii]|uniref:radical SAM protein n=1 Tax=Vibrio owensii TaxID=696485 RepID=UPI003CC5ED6E